MLKRLQYYFLAIFILVGENTFAISVQSDFDSDGYSEITVVSVLTNKALSWKTKSYLNASTLNEGTFGKSGDHIIMGEWDGFAIGVVKEDEQSGKLTWRIRKENGEVKEFEFGTNKELVVSGGDFDGDGRLDASTVKSGKKLKWQIAYNPFAVVSPIQTKNFSFGDKSGKAFFIDLDGTGDWAGVLEKDINKSGKYKARLRNVTSGEERLINMGNSSQRPQPVEGPDGKDVFAFVEQDLEKTTVTFRNQKGKKFAAVTIPTPNTDDGGVVIGNFTDEPGEEVGIQSGEEYIIFNPITNGYSAVSALPGVPVDSINIESFTSIPSDDEPIKADNCGKLNMPDGDQGNLWKANSDTQYYAVFVAHSQYTGKISKVSTYDASSGSKIKDLTYKGSGNGNRQNYQDYSLTGSAYKSKYGAIRIVMQLKSGGCLSAVLSDPSKRVD